MFPPVRESHMEQDIERKMETGLTSVRCIPQRVREFNWDMILAPGGAV